MSINDPTKPPLQNKPNLGNLERHKTVTEPEIVDISSGWDTSSRWEIIKERLSQLNIEQSQILLSGCSSEKIPDLQALGTYRAGEPAIFGSTVEYLDDPHPLVSIQNPVNFALDAQPPNQPVLAVYNLSNLEIFNSRGEDVAYSYKPVAGKTFKDALVAIFILKEK